MKLEDLANQRTIVGTVAELVSAIYDSLDKIAGLVHSEQVKKDTPSEEKWGVGNAAEAESFSTLMVGKAEVGAYRWSSI